MTVIGTIVNKKTPQAGAEFPDSSWFLFEEWCCSLGLSYFDAAEVLGITVYESCDYKDRRKKTPPEIVEKCREISIKENKMTEDIDEDLTNEIAKMDEEVARILAEEDPEERAFKIWLFSSKWSTEEVYGNPSLKESLKRSFLAVHSSNKYYFLEKR